MNKLDKPRKLWTKLKDLSPHFLVKENVGLNKSPPSLKERKD
jgi:hypothetical protein